MSKRYTKVYQEPLSIPPIEGLFQRIAIYFVGSLPLTNNRYINILICIGYATRFYILSLPLQIHDVEILSVAIISMFPQYALQKELLSDQGSQFISTLLNRYANYLR